MSLQDAAASQPLHKVGLDSWEPDRTQPTKQPLLPANFILLLSSTQFWVSRSSESKHQCKSTFLWVSFCCYTQLNMLTAVTFLFQATKKKYPHISAWKPVPGILNLSGWTMSNSRKAHKDDFHHSGWQVEILNQSKPFPLAWAWLTIQVLRKEVSHSYPTVLRESRHWAHDICGQSSSTTIQTAEPKTRMSA